MATVINNPSEGGSGAGVFATIVIAVLVIILLVWGISAMRNSSPAGPNVQVPDSLDVNVQPN